MHFAFNLTTLEATSAGAAAGTSGQDLAIGLLAGAAAQSAAADGASEDALLALGEPTGDAVAGSAVFAMVPAAAAAGQADSSGRKYTLTNIPPGAAPLQEAEHKMCAYEELDLAVKTANGEKISDQTTSLNKFHAKLVVSVKDHPEDLFKQVQP